MRGIIFDLDGTLFQTEKVAVPAFQETFRILQKNGWHEGNVPSEREIQSVFGMTHEEIWARLLPGSDEETKEKADRIMLEKELEMFEQDKGMLYPDVEKTLHELKQDGWALFIASNGAGPYVRGALDSKGLTSLFQGIYAAGDYETNTKVDLVKICKEKHGISGGFMVGDRSSDVEAGKANQLTVIGCRYVGFPHFGEEEELAEADYTIRRFAELLTLVSL